MATLPPPMFWGLLTVGSSNNTIHWNETNGATPVDLSVTIPSGTYYPDSALSSESLASVIGTYMGTESASSGYSFTYTVTVSKTDGTLSIGGSDLFYLKTSTSESNKLLTGGDVAEGKQGGSHFGWLVDAAATYPGHEVVAVGDTQVGHAWHPQGPVTNSTVVAGDDSRHDSLVTQVETMGGKATIRDYLGPVTPADTAYRERRILECQYLTDSDRLAYIEQFWLPHAKTGGKFRYYPERTDLTTYEERHLFGESLQRVQPTRTPGYPYFALPLETKLWKG